MNLKQYKNRIKDQLLGDIKKQVHKDKVITAGHIGAVPSCYGANYSPHDHITQLLAHHKLQGDYAALVRRMNKMKGPSIDMTGHADAGYSGGGFCESDSESDGGCMRRDPPKKALKKVTRKCVDSDSDAEVRGGKFHFAKSMKSFGKSVGHTVQDIGTAAKKASIQKVGNEIANEGVSQMKNFGSKLMTTAVADAPEMAAVAEEGAPLLLAAGMKQKRTRKMSQKELNRHALIRKLMSKHNCSLAQASKFIKEKNLPY